MMTANAGNIMTNDSRDSSTPRPSIQIFIDLSGHPDWYRRELEGLI
jgi:hypothetical protein